MTNHHAIWDGWSIPIVLRDLLALYRGDEPGRAPGLGAVVRELAASSGGGREFWGHVLGGVEPCLIGTGDATGSVAESLSRVIDSSCRPGSRNWPETTA